MYRHRQTGGITLVVLLVPAIFCTILAWRSDAWWMYLIALVLVLIGWLFSSLTIAVDDHDLVSWFGPGWWRYRVPLRSIGGVERTTSSALEGWGIRFTPRGMLYNVTGCDAVEIRLENGRRFRLGTDDPDGLIVALQSRTRPSAA